MKKKSCKKWHKQISLPWNLKQSLLVLFKKNSEDSSEFYNFSYSNAKKRENYLHY